MKYIIILLLFITTSFAGPVSQDLDDAFSYRFEEETGESRRGIANEKVKPSNKKVEVIEDPDRDLASDGEVSDDALQKKSEGVKYWKY